MCQICVLSLSLSLSLSLCVCVSLCVILMSLATDSLDDAPNCGSPAASCGTDQVQSQVPPSPACCECSVAPRSKGVMKPMQELLDEDFKELKRQKKEFWKSQSETHSLIDKLCQVSHLVLSGSSNESRNCEVLLVNVYYIPTVQKA